MAEIETIRYMTSLLTFYIKSEISFERNMITFVKPNTVLKFIPVGMNKSTLPVNQMSSVSSSFRFSLGRFFWGIALVFIGLSYRFDGLDAGANFLVSLIFLLLGANMVIKAFETRLSIKTTASSSIDIGFYVFEKEKAFKAERIMNGIISERLDDTNMSDQTDRLVDAINGLKK